jgi:ligand-binding sensor protein
MAKQLIETLTGSKIYQDYERAFSEATGLPVTLRAVESWQLPQHGKRFENPFCAMLSEKSRACAACLQVQQQLSETATSEPKTITCQAGLCDIAIPVRMGDQLIGFLATGQVFIRKPTEALFNRTAKLLAEWGVETDIADLRKAFFETRVLSARQHDSVVKLLSIFAEHLSMVSNQIVLREQNTEAPSSPAPSSSSRTIRPRNSRWSRSPRPSTPANFTSARFLRNPPASISRTTFPACAPNGQRTSCSTPISA